jgi:SAM-dependent methyltransferase
MSREARAFDEGRVAENNYRWVARVPHVMTGPNSKHGDRCFLSVIGARAAGGSAMDIGCGTGRLTARLHGMGARTVYGFDISQRQVEEARTRCDDMEGVTFGVHGVEVPVAGRFDAIVGHSILHHLDYRSTLERLFEDNLLPGGRMVFMEPMSHPITLAFHRLITWAHTPDEWPFTPADIAWLQQRFAARVLPINLLSYPVGIFSSYVLSRNDNRLMRLADRVDRSLERRRRLIARGRQGIIVIDRPAI